MHSDNNCPICHKQLVEFTSAKDLSVSDGENDVNLGQLSVNICLDCNFIDYDSVWFI